MYPPTCAASCLILRTAGSTFSTSINACPVRMIIADAVDALMFWSRSAADCASSVPTPVVTASRIVDAARPTALNAGAEATCVRADADAFATGWPRPSRSGTAAPAVLEALSPLLSLHAAVASANAKAIEATFIGDSVSVSLETPPEPSFAHRHQTAGSIRPCRPLSAGRDQPAA